MSLAALDQKFSILDELPESLYSTVITHTHGELLTRVAGIMQWREALLNGLLPEESELVWPESGLRRTVLQRLEVLNIVAYCKEQIELTDNILKDICDGISTAEDFYKQTPNGFIDKLAQRQNIRDHDSPFDDPEGLADHVEQQDGDGINNNDSESQLYQTNESHNLKNINADTSEQNQQAEISNEAQELNQYESSINGLTESNAIAAESEELSSSTTGSAVVGLKNNNDIEQSVSDYIDQQWLELSENWHELAETFSELSELLGRGWDLTQGVLASQGWRDIVRFRKLIKQIPELKALIKTLGRLQAISGDNKIDSVSETLFNSMKRMVEDEDETMTYRAVMETGGIDRSDELSRILPSELALLGYPKLKMLWHARRAERLLMTYRYSGLLPDVKEIEIEDETEWESPPQENNSSEGNGPIIICLDTSGSMHGEPEQIAKALVLEALRIAWNEQRECYVYTFGGPEEILQHELDLTQGGLGKLLDFLQFSFHGGTDVAKPLIKAIEKQSSEGWERADILLISDGRFPAHNELFTKIKKMKSNQGLRLHGLLLGSWKGSTIEQLCEPLHRFNDWHDIGR
jgi:uncharacterized protein with von Willebrand factor type A (vWA) domain